MKSAPGLPLWLPNGGVILNELESLAKKQKMGMDIAM
ncbi:MAG: hypothetical protein Ct9H90mP20_7430 [Candidatus Neomarinimicrobiota bacterium]|nr:MAG: hypothetical protein Ct9H90mP20_7430 [Candidatus Neomarinimicrobiota bacterium]